MNVLCDRHQADLYYAMQKLFEDRLGLDLYTPVGHAWWDEGYWRFGEVFGDDRLAKQYLDIQVPTVHDGRGVIYDQCHDTRPIATVTLDAARELGDWAFVVATVQENQAGLRRFADEVGARFVVQAGNTGQRIDWSLDPLVISTSEMPILGQGVTVHQEFDSDTVFWFSNPKRAIYAEEPTISTFVNLTPRIPQAQSELRVLQELLGDRFKFRVYGHEGPDGFITPVERIADLMASSTWGYHHKPQGDGFGHVIHGWAAIGRPLVGPSAPYQGKLAEPFWEDLVTCVDTSRRSVEEAAALVLEISADPDRYLDMCFAIRETFDSLVDYDAEEAEIRKLLGL